GIVEAFEAVALKLELARLRLQPAQEFPRVVGWQRVRFRYVFLSVFPEPAERNRRPQLLLFRRHDKVAATNEFLPGNMLRQVGGVEHALDPIDFVDSLG